MITVDPPRNILADLNWGIRWGLMYAGAFWVLAITVTLVRVLSGQPPDPGDVSLPGALLYELLAGLLGGIAGGVFRKHTDSLSGAILLGWLIASLSTMVCVLVLPRDVVGRAVEGGDWLGVLLLSVATGLLVGPAVGYATFKRYHGDDSES